MEKWTGCAVRSSRERASVTWASPPRAGSPHRTIRGRLGECDHRRLGRHRRPRHGLARRARASRRAGDRPHRRDRGAAWSGRDVARRAGAGRDSGPERSWRAHRVAADRGLGLHRDARVPHVHPCRWPGLRRRGSRGRGRRAARRHGGLRHPRRRRVRRQLALGGTDRAGRGRGRRSRGRCRRQADPSPRARSAPGPG